MVDEVWSFCYSKSRNVPEKYAEQFGAFAENVDYAMLVKMYGSENANKNPDIKYSPAECTGTRVAKINGEPDPK
jgi:hypothetical protein